MCLISFQRHFKCRGDKKALIVARIIQIFNIKEPEQSLKEFLSLGKSLSTGSFSFYFSLFSNKMKVNAGAQSKDLPLVTQPERKKFGPTQPREKWIIYRNAAAPENASVQHITTSLRSSFNTPPPEPLCWLWREANDNKLWHLQMTPALWMSSHAVRSWRTEVEEDNTLT